VKPLDIEVQTFLRGVTSVRTRRLAEAARATVLEAVPHAIERLRPGWRLIGYDAPAYFAFISVAPDHVEIGFEWGVMLTDPSRLLEGTGTQVRYVTIRSSAALRSPALRALIRQAAAIVPPRRRAPTQRG
jgi:hypothetical protein